MVARCLGGSYNRLCLSYNGIAVAIADGVLLSISSYTFLVFPIANTVDYRGSNATDTMLITMGLQWVVTVAMLTMRNMREISRRR